MTFRNWLKTFTWVGVLVGGLFQRTYFHTGNKEYNNISGSGLFGNWLVEDFRFKHWQGCKVSMNLAFPPMSFSLQVNTYGR